MKFHHCILAYKYLLHTGSRSSDLMRYFRTESGVLYLNHFSIWFFLLDFGSIWIFFFLKCANTKHHGNFTELFDLKYDYVNKDRLSHPKHKNHRLVTNVAAEVKSEMQRFAKLVTDITLHSNTPMIHTPEVITAVRSEETL